MMSMSASISDPLSSNPDQTGALETRIPLWVACGLLAAILWYSDAWLYVTDSQFDTTYSKPFGYILRGLVLLFGMVTLYVMGAGEFLSFIRRNIYYFLFLGFAALSVLWSDYPNEAFISFLNISALVLICAFISSRLDMSYVLTVSHICFAAIVVLSFLVVFLLPSYGMMDGVHAGRFRGLFSHKNNMGLFLFIHISTLLYFWREIKLSKIFKSISIVLSLVLTAGAQSSTEFAIVFIFFFAVFFVSFIRKLTNNFIVGISLVLILSVVAAFVADFVASSMLEILGRDTTLSGRDTIWNYYIQAAMDSPIIGHGHMALQSNPRLALDALVTLYFAARSPHNVYIEIMYNYGYAGLFFYCLFLVNSLIANFRGIISASNEAEFSCRRFSFAFIVCVIFYGVVESYQAGTNPGIPMMVLFLVSSGNAYKKGDATG